MNKKEAIELLRQALSKIPHLRELHYDNQEFKLWRNRVETIIKYGLDGDDYNTFESVEPLAFLDDIGIENIEQSLDYPKKLKDYETALKSIIQKYEMLGIDGKPAATSEPSEVPGDGKEREMMELMQPPLIDRLKTYYEELIEYKKLEGNRLALTTEEHKRHKFLREKLLRESQIFKDKIIELTNYHYIKVEGKTYDIWVEAFDNNFFSISKWPSIDHCIDSTNIAIGKLESIELSKTRNYSNLSTPQEIASYLFDKMQLHPRIIKASKSLFISGHYAEAIFAACKAINNFTKRKAGQSLDGKDLMAKVFNEDKPIIKINKLITRSERDEQEGFRFLYMGAMVGIRNPKAHDDIRQIDPYKALEYLAFASLLMRRVTEGKLEPKGA